MAQTEEAAEEKGLLAVEATTQDKSGLIDLGDGLKIRLDFTTYDKTAVLKPGVGYEARQNADAILAGVLHTTDGNKGSSFADEAAYLMNAKDRSAHYLISKPEKGVITIAMIVPEFLAAWHAGISSARGYAEWNQISIGVELHCAGDQGEEIDPLQMRAAAWLFSRIRRHHPNMYMLEMHRTVAAPHGRKHDPTGLSDEAFKAWVDSFWHPAW